MIDYELYPELWQKREAIVEIIVDEEQEIVNKCSQLLYGDYEKKRELIRIQKIRETEENVRMLDEKIHRINLKRKMYTTKLDMCGICGEYLVNIIDKCNKIHVNCIKRRRGEEGYCIKCGHEISISNILLGKVQCQKCIFNYTSFNNYAKIDDQCINCGENIELSDALRGYKKCLCCKLLK